MINWLIQSAADNQEIDQGIAPAGLLSAGEAATLAELRVLKRRRDWLLGRWTAKQLVQRTLADQGDNYPSLSRIVIENDEDGAPFAALLQDDNSQGDDLQGDKWIRLPWSLSISHSNGVAICAVHPLHAADKRYAIGVDLELIEPREANFVAGYFTPAEMTCVAQAVPAMQPAVVTAIWSAKEAVLKALRTGLRLDTRTIHCVMPGALPVTDAWQAFLPAVDPGIAPGAVWSGWWCRPPEYADFMLTLAIKTEEAR